MGREHGVAGLARYIELPDRKEHTKRGFAGRSGFYVRGRHGGLSHEKAAPLVSLLLAFIFIATASILWIRTPVDCPLAVQ